MDFDQFPKSLTTKTGWVEYLSTLMPAEPHVHQIEPTNHCPYDCIMCPRGKKMSRKLGYMDMAVYQKIIDEIATYDAKVRNKEIELFHFGESLLHPEIVSMLHYADEKNLNMVLSVNAPQLTPKLTEDILRLHPFKLIISLDGFDEKSYKHIRGPAANYQKAMANIDYLIRLLEEEEFSDKTEVIIRIIRLNANSSHIDQFADYWQKKGLKVEIRPFFPWSEKELVELGEVQKYPPGMPCPFPWQYLVVQWDGSVVPCCRDYNGVNIMGNVKEHSLTEIWQSTLYKSFRKQHESGNYSDNNFCKACMDIFYTPPLDEQAQTELITCQGCASNRNTTLTLTECYTYDPVFNQLTFSTKENQKTVIHLDADQEALLFLLNQYCCLNAIAKQLNVDEKDLYRRVRPLIEKGILHQQNLTLPLKRIAEENQTFPSLWEDLEKSEDYPLIISEDGSMLSSADADHLVRLIINRLQAEGINKGDHIVILTNQNIEAVLLIWASLYLGAVIVPLRLGLPPTLLAEILDELTPSLVFSEPNDLPNSENKSFRQVIFDTAIETESDKTDSTMFSDWLDLASPTIQQFQVFPTDLGAILYTSGTSGRPKGVQLSQAALFRSGKLMASTFGWQHDDRILSLGSFHTMSGLRNPCLAILHARCSAFILSPNSRTDCLSISSIIAQNQLTVLTCVPETLRQFNYIAKHVENSDLSSIRMVLSTGTMLTPEVKLQFKENFSTPVYNYYGLTETSGICSAILQGEEGEATNNSIGQPQECIMRLEKQDGSSCRTGEIGELSVFSLNTMLGYYKQQHLTNTKITNGWFSTGDLARQTQDGSIILIGRAGDAFKTRLGELVYPEEIERFLEQQDNIKEAGIYHPPESNEENIIHAFLVPTEPPERPEVFFDAINKQISQHYSSLSSTVSFTISTSLPKGSNGKLLRKDLKKLL